MSATNPMPMLLGIRTDDLNFNDRDPCAFSDGNPCIPGYRHGINRIRNDRAADTKIILGEAIGDCVTFGRNI